jgi:aryl-alcohol dehydrogenase-like predicted oxidoreductase
VEYRACGKSGLELSVLGIGCWSFGGGESDYWGPQDQRDAGEVVARALDMGVNYFDTAEGYNDGRSEEALGAALGRRRAEAVIGTKVAPENTQPAVLREHCEASLRRLGTDTIDLYMVHWPITQHSVADAFATLIALKQEGKIRHIGVSNFGVNQLSEALATGVEIAADQLAYSLLTRSIELEILPMCRDQGIGVLPYMPLMQGLLTGKYRTPDDVPPLRARTRHFRGDRPLARHGESGAETETFAALELIAAMADRRDAPMSALALAWAAARPEISSVIVGVRNLAQLEDALRGIETPLSPEEVAELNAATEPVLRVLGTNADIFQGGDRGRVR